MRVPTPRIWALVLFSALLQVLIFPLAGPLPYARAVLCWVCLTPLLGVVLEPREDGKPRSIRSSATLGYLCGVAWYCGNCYWIYQTMYLYDGLPKPVALLILVLFSLYLGLYHALFTALLAWCARGKWGWRGALALSPFLWVAVELARARVTGFPWDLLGLSQVDNALLTRLAPLTGAYGLSFVLVAANAIFAWALLRRTRQAGWTGMVAAGVCLGVHFAGGSTALLPKIAAPDQLAVMMQENLKVGVEAVGQRRLSPAEEVQQFSLASLAPQRLGSTVATPGARPTVILWPEAPSHLQSNDPALRDGLARLARAAGATVIAGSMGVDRDDARERGYDLYDSAALVTPDGAWLGRYDKIHLVPWGEYVPFKQFFAFASKLTEGAGDMDPGRERRVFHSAGHTYGVFICYESIFGDEVRQFVQNGAQVLVNLSDDGWYRDTGAPWQHLNMARMRALENDRWVLRDTNTGVTTAIDPNGRMAFQAPRHVRGAFAFPFAFVEGTTFYTRHGDWLAWLCVLVSACGAGYAAATRRALR